ncbi:TPA: tail fiber protein [Enterobacter hormaechei]|nr:tail fiber protein [Enterobacter hormaechei]
MTDKTPQNKADILVKTPTARAGTGTGTGTTDAARNSGPESRALPEAGALKDRFKAGSIPLQTDFADLIDLANMGRQAVGGAEGQTGPADGFTLSSMGRLELKPNTDKGISVDKDGVAVKVNTSNGLKMTSSGIAINDGLGIEFSSTGQLKIKVKKDGGFSGGPGGAYVIPGEGITTGSSGVGVKAGNGIAVTSSGVNVKLSKGAHNNGGGGQGTDGFTSIGSAGGLALSSNGLSVDAGNGIQIDSQGVSIKLATNSGLSADQTNGLKIVPEQMFQKGMIMMFSGTKAETPKGWALCDGGSGTPDLRDRFIVMAGTKFTGKGDGTTTTGSSTVTGTVNVAETTLTTAQIPSHSHDVELNSLNYSYLRFGEVNWINVHREGKDQNAPKVIGKTKETGSGQGHKHTATMTTSSHSHTISAIPPYYALAFIMKL